MSRIRRWLANGLLDHAASVMPPARVEWARAMLAEAAHLLPHEHLPFALGCVASSYRERLADPATVLATGRWSIIFGLCAATAVCLRTAYRLPAGDPSALILALGLICLAAAVAFIRWGLRRLPAVAAVGFAAVLVAMLVLGDAAALTGAMPSSRFYRAILLEQFVAWAALFGFAHSLLVVESRRDANG